MRFPVSLLGGLMVALLLFRFDHFLVSQPKKYDTDSGNLRVVEFIRVNEGELVQFKERVPPKEPPPPDRPPPPPKVQMTADAAPPAMPVAFEAPRIDVPMGQGDGPYLGNWRGSAGNASADGDALPIVRIEPQYPRDALVGGIEGWVRLEFTIMEDGSVSDVVVLEADPPRVFNRNAIRAVLRWKFKPRIENGKPIKRRGSQVIEFLLDNV